MKKEICIPTYKRPEAINELFLRYLDIYTNMGFDIHIYDSSDDVDTKEVFDKYSDNDRLFYHAVDPKVHSNMKVYDIYEEFVGGDYEYIWVQSDSIRWTLDSLNIIKDAINTGKHDLIIPNYRDVEQIGTREYEDINAFFRDCAWHMTLYGATIVRKSVLDNINWEELKKKYGVSDRINFSHVGMYFEQIANMECFKALHIGLPLNSLSSSLYKKGSGWRKDTFFIHCECWPSVINALPDVYVYKKEVIKKQGKNAGDLTTEGIKKLRSEGVLTPRTIHKYASVWEEVSDIPLRTMCFYAYIPPKIARSLMDETKAERRRKKQIKRFSRQYNRLFLYGCGLKGDYYGELLEEMNIDYEGYLISKGISDKKMLRGKPVREIASDLINDESVGIIISLYELKTEQVLESLVDVNVKAGIYTEYAYLYDKYL